MKKISVVIAALLLLIAAVIPAMAAGVNFTVDIAGDTVVSSGDTVSYTFTVNDISETDINGKLMSATIEVKFDPTVLEFVSAEGKALSGWEMNTNTSDAGSGKIKLLPMETHDGANATSADGKIKYTVKFKVLATEKTGTQITLTKAKGDSTDYNSYDGSFEPLNITITKKLGTASNLTWEGQTAKWDAVPNASEYAVQLYKGTQKSGDAVTVSGTQYNFSSLMKLGGDYYFTVVALSDSQQYKNGDESAKSAANNHVGTLITPTIRLTPNPSVGGLSYTIADNNKAGLVEDYEIEIFKNGTSVAKLTVANKTGNLPVGKYGITAGEIYTAKVQAISKEPLVNNNSSVSTMSAEAQASVSPCAHSETTVDRKEPTCTEDGYEKKVCNSCGETVEETKLTATGSHTYGEWEIVLEPTTSQNGMKKRVCSSCGAEESELIPASTSTGETTPNDTTDNGGSTTDNGASNRPTTEGPQTPPDEDVGDMSNMSRIFLIAVIIIFSLALIFIIGGVYLDNRKAKMRSGNRRIR